MPSNPEEPTRCVPPLSTLQILTAIQAEILQARRRVIEAQRMLCASSDETSQRIGDLMACQVADLAEVYGDLESLKDTAALAAAGVDND